MACCQLLSTYQASDPCPRSVRRSGRPLACSENCLMRTATTQRGAIASSSLGNSPCQVPALLPCRGVFAGSQPQPNKVRHHMITPALGGGSKGFGSKSSSKRQPRAPPGDDLQPTTGAGAGLMDGTTCRWTSIYSKAPAECDAAWQASNAAWLQEALENPVTLVNGASLPAEGTIKVPKVNFNPIA